jgi:eukaryotic-like serine/threonine-protein kinase
MAKPASNPASLIAGQYAVELDHPLPGAGGGLPAFTAVDRRSGRRDLMAVQVQPHRPPRARVLDALTGVSIEGVLGPLAHGPLQLSTHDGGYFVVCPTAPGPALSAPLRPWREAALFEEVLLPGVAALQRLQARGVTHRAIRLNNMFHARPGMKMVLGGAWAAPPASLQPVIYEPPYAAMCLPAGRGDGAIADDVYALGVALLVLALGRVPLPGLDDEAITQRKLAQGSYAALAGEQRLPPAIADLVRGMLAEDPEHRPSLAVLADPGTARGRRVPRRAGRRAQAPLVLGGSKPGTGLRSPTRWRGSRRTPCNSSARATSIAGSGARSAMQRRRLAWRRRCASGTRKRRWMRPAAIGR